MEPERRYPVSVYFTPKGYKNFQDFVEGSGYGSSSRTVEEIILAFRKIKFELDFFYASSREIIANREVPVDARHKMVEDMREKAFDAIVEAADRVDSQRLKERRKIWKEKGILPVEGLGDSSPYETR